MAASPPPIQAFDWQRVFLGEDPAGFYAEILFRSVFMYICLLLLLRLLSKRALSQLSILEFGLVIALGSAAGDPTFYKDVPLLHGLLVLATIVALQLVQTWLLTRNESVETLLEGVPRELVCDGVIQMDELKKARLSREELFESLRLCKIRHLGEVERAYLEQSGQISVIAYEKPRPGLQIVPPWDLSPPPSLMPADTADLTGSVACLNCGQTRELKGKEIGLCGNCQDLRVTYATLDPLQKR